MSAVVICRHGDPLQNGKLSNLGLFHMLKLFQFIKPLIIGEPIIISSPAPFASASANQLASHLLPPRNPRLFKSLEVSQERTFDAKAALQTVWAEFRPSTTLIVVTHAAYVEALPVSYGKQAFNVRFPIVGRGAHVISHETKSFTSLAY